MAASDVNLASILTRDMHLSKNAVRCVLAHGQVTLDGEPVTADTLIRPWAEVRGKELAVLNRRRRLGNPLAPEHVAAPDVELTTAVCQSCGAQTSLEEAALRRFLTGLCLCGGELA